MKSLITLTLILLAPALASATNPPCTLGSPPCVATAGSLTISSGPFGLGASFNASGSGFTASGGWVDVILAGLANAGEITSGEPLKFGWNANVDGGFSMSVSVDGVGYTTGPGGGIGLSGGGFFGGSSFKPITGAGVYKGPLGFEGEINGAVGCPTNCQGIFVSGGGIGTFVSSIGRTLLLAVLFAGVTSSAVTKTPPERRRSRGTLRRTSALQEPLPQRQFVQFVLAAPPAAAIAKRVTAVTELQKMA